VIDRFTAIDDLHRGKARAHVTLPPLRGNPYRLRDVRRPRRSLLSRLDAFETAASMLSIVLLAAMTGAILGALYYAITHWPEGYGIGPQGELFYLAIGFILVIGWVLGQLSWIIRRRRRDAWTFKDGSEIPLPTITTSNEGFSINWGNRSDLGDASSADMRSWSATIPVSIDNTRTFRLDADALAAARAARSSGTDWEELCRQMNPEWPTMNALDRALYRNALEAALNTADYEPGSPNGTT
jgi:hypothetical protein